MGIKQGFLGGVVVGVTNAVAFFAYALALWYGSTRVAAGAYSGAPLPPLLMTVCCTAAFFMLLLPRGLPACCPLPVAPVCYPTRWH